MRAIDEPIQRKKIAVFGSGAFGTALGFCAAKNGHEVVIISRQAEVVQKINETRKHPSRLVDANYKLPANVRATTDPAEALQGCDYILHTVPVQYTRVTLLAYQQWIGDIPIISASKGIESESLMYMSQLVPDVLKKQHPMAFLSGPSFAKELVEEQPTAVVVASESDALCSAVQNIFLSPRLRVYTSNDVIGTEVGGALKNVIAIGAGICAGMNLGLNTMAMLITRGTSEMMKLALRMGAQPTTLSGLSGIGDLILTCYGPLSRNRTVGKLLGEGKTMEEVAKLQVEVAEGVFTAAAAAKLCEKLNLDLPIIQAIAAVLAGKVSAQDAVKKLMMIPVGPELATVFVN